MRKYIRLLLLLTPLIAHTQNVNDSIGDNKLKIDLNVNATKFVKQFVNFNNSNFEISPYLFGMRIIKGKNNLRWNYGIDYSSSTRKGSDNENTLNINNHNFRVGYLREIILSKNFSSYLGPDLVFSYLDNMNKSSGNGFSSEQSTRNTSFGVGLNFGFQWNLSKRIAIYTESTLLLENQSGSQNSKTSSGGQTFENNFTTSGSTARFVAPTSIFFHFKF